MLPRCCFGRAATCRKQCIDRAGRGSRFSYYCKRKISKLCWDETRKVFEMLTPLSSPPQETNLLAAPFPLAPLSDLMESSSQFGPMTDPLSSFSKFWQSPQSLQGDYSCRCFKADPINSLPMLNKSRETEINTTQYPTDPRLLNHILPRLQHLPRN